MAEEVVDGLLAGHFAGGVGSRTAPASRRAPGESVKQRHRKIGARRYFPTVGNFPSPAAACGQFPQLETWEGAVPSLAEAGRWAVASAP
jgi:hypothetical protein